MTELKMTFFFCFVYILRGGGREGGYCWEKGRASERGSEVRSRCTISNHCAKIKIDIVHLGYNDNSIRAHGVNYLDMEIVTISLLRLSL